MHKSSPNIERDIYRKYIKSFFDLTKLNRSASDLIIEVQELEDFIFPYNEEKYFLEWDINYATKVLGDFLWYRNMTKLIQYLRFMVNDIVIYWKSFVGVKYDKDAGWLLTIGSMYLLDPYTIKINKDWAIFQIYSLVWYFLSTHIEKRKTSIDINNIWGTWLNKFKSNYSIKKLINLRSYFMNYTIYKSHWSLHHDDHYLPIEKSRYTSYSTQKWKYESFNLQIRRKLNLPSRSYITSEISQISDYYEVFTLIRAKKKALFIRQILISDFNRILNYINRENHVDWILLKTKHFFSNEDFDNVFELFKEGKVNKETAINIIYLEDWSYYK